ncbi:MAG: PAS domain S-box protein [Actinomycetota bacterium]|nr:PAS domain S-box protein [Actinomycetota bacterium]
MSPSSEINKEQLDTPASAIEGRKAERLAALDDLNAIRPETDHILQQLTDEVRGIFGTDLCMVNLNLSDVQYFRTWSGELPAELAEARQDALEHSMCQYVVDSEMPLVVKDFSATEEFREQHWCVNYGIHFYAGTPLITSDDHAIGTLCLLNAQPIEFGQDQVRVLGGFAQAVVGRLELLGALGREQSAREREARRSEDRQRTLDSLSAHIAIVDETGAIVAVNKAWRDFARANGAAAQKYAEGANYLRACDSAAGAYSEEAAPFAEGIRSVLGGQREKFELEYPCHSPSERRWFIGRVTQFAAAGPPRAVVAHENITERKLVEERLHENERQFRALFENTLEAILIASDTGEYVGANEAACELFGVSLDELLGSKVEDFVEPTERHQTRLAWEAFLAQGEQEGEFPLHRPDGEMRSLEFKAKAGFLPGRHLSVLRDVTERKRAEEALRESEATLNSILNNLDEGVLVADTQGHVVFVNSVARSILGVPDGKPLDELPDPWEGFDLPEAIAHCTRHKESIEAGVRYEETFLRVKVECLVELDQSRGGVLVVIQDLSEGRQLEANQQRFLANAAHQLRTPIMAIVGSAELLATGEDADPAIRRRLLNHIFSEGRRMQRLSEVLLSLSRIGWDRREPDLDIVDLREAGQQTTKLMEPLAESGGLRILTEGEGSFVHADPEWLQEVLMVVLSNAIKHSNRGGDIKVRTKPGVVTVKDEGAGISPVDLPHVFERFYKGTGSSEGFGLGLAICKDLTERMGGSISIRSREGVGTSVEIELPEVGVDAQHTDR